MRAYLAHKFYSDGRNRNLVESIADSLEKEGIETFVMARDFEDWGKNEFSSSKLMELSFRQIEDCDFLIVEFSEKGVGLGIESGYAYAKDKPIFIIAKKDSEISLTLRGIANKIIFYNNPEDVGHKIKSELIDIGVAQK